MGSRTGADSVGSLTRADSEGSLKLPEACVGRGGYRYWRLVAGLTPFSAESSCG